MAADSNGADEVLARAITDRMRVPLLDYVRGEVSREDFLKILEIAQGAITSTNTRTETPLLIWLGLKLAAEMYEEGAMQLAAISGRGRGGQN